MSSELAPLEAFLRAAPFGGVGITTACAMLFALRILLPKEERFYIRTPLILLILHVSLVALCSVLPPEGVTRSTLSLLALFLILASLGRCAFLLILHSIVLRRLSRPLPKIFRDLIQAFIYAAAVLVTLRAAGVEPGSLLTTSALLTAVVGLSLRDTLGNTFAGLAIHAERPFGKGDWIQFDENPEHTGQVVEMNWRAVKVQTLSRVEVTVPNSSLANAPIRNFSKPTSIARRSTFVVAPYRVAPHDVQRLLEEAVRDTPEILPSPAPSVLTHDFTDRGIQYWVRYFIDDFSKRERIDGSVRDRLWYALHRAGIEIPPPLRATQVYEVSSEDTARMREEQIRARERALAAVDFLAPVPSGARRQIAEISETRLYGEGEIIIHEGAEGDALFLLEWGEVLLLVDQAGVGEVEVARLGPGQFFGEMSVLMGTTRKTTIRASRETQLLVVDRKSLQHVLESAPELADQISQLLADRETELGELAQAAQGEEQSIHERKGVLLNRIKDFFSL